MERERTYILIGVIVSMELATKYCVSSRIAIHVT